MVFFWGGQACKLFDIIWLCHIMRRKERLGLAHTGHLVPTSIDCHKAKWTATLYSCPTLPLYIDDGCPQGLSFLLWILQFSSARPIWVRCSTSAGVFSLKSETELNIHIHCARSLTAAPRCGFWISSVCYSETGGCCSLVFVSATFFPLQYLNCPSLAYRLTGTQVQNLGAFRCGGCMNKVCRAWFCVQMR